MDPRTARAARCVALGMAAAACLAAVTLLTAAAPVDERRAPTAVQPPVAGARSAGWHGDGGWHVRDRAPGAVGTWEVIDRLDSTWLWDVDMLSADQGWAVGGDLSQSPAAGTILRYDRGAWRPVASPITTTISAIDMVTPSVGWAVAGYHILRYDGAEWRVQHDASEVLFAVEMVSEDEGWASGFGEVLHYQDGVWSTVPGMVGAWDFAMLGPDDGWAGASSLLWRLDGDTWRSVPWPGSSEWAVVGIDATGPDDAWFVGGHDSDGRRAILHYDHGRFEETLVSGLSLMDVDMVASDEGWAVGRRGGESGEALLVHRRAGGTWHDVGAGFSGTLLGIHMVSPREGWAVGARYEEAGGGNAVLLHYTVAEPTPRPTAGGTATSAATTATPTASATHATPAATSTYTSTVAPPTTLPTGASTATAGATVSATNSSTDTPTGPAPSPTPTVHTHVCPRGFVHDAVSGEAVRNARVVLQVCGGHGYEARTDDRGWYDMGCRLTNGDFEPCHEAAYTVSARGYVTATLTFPYSVPGGTTPQPLWVDFELDRALGAEVYLPAAYSRHRSAEGG